MVDPSHSERLYRVLAMVVADLVTLHARDGTILYASPSAKPLTGYEAHELVGRNLSHLVDDDAGFGRGVGFPSPPTDGDSCCTTQRIRCRDGRVRFFECTARHFPADEDGEYVVVSRDVTERLRLDAELERAQQRFRHLAYHDARTGLYNREGFFTRLDEAIGATQSTAPKGSRSGLSVLCLDIDNFKSINDVRGHGAGDELIAAFAARLRQATPAEWTIARTGGDEFAVLVPYGDPTRLETLARTLLHDLAQAVPLRSMPAWLTVSIGVARHPVDRGDAEALLAAADIAMHAAKRSGKNTWRFYDTELGRSASRQALSLQTLRNAFERGEFTLHYQPKISLATGACTGYEALLRWNSATGVRGTAALIAAAEQSGFISTLGEWVLRSAARQSRAWRDVGFDAPIAVNVSAMQLLDRRFVDAVSELVAIDPALPRHLVFELTESTFAMETDRAVQAVCTFAERGFEIHIDDFGTGYSSLARLSRLPVRTLKIDRSFVSATPQRADACEIVKAIVALARALRMNVIAEGVETPAQLDFLTASGCDEAQGYLFGRPVAPDAIVVPIEAVEG